MNRRPPSSPLFPYPTLFRSEPDLPAHRPAEGGVELLGDALGHRARGDPPRLGVPDPTAHATAELQGDRKSTRLNSSHANISYAVFCLKKKKQYITIDIRVVI